MVPTRNGAPHVFIIADEYQRTGVKPLFLVDSRSSRQFKTDAIARIETVSILKLGRKEAFIEAILPDIAKSVGSKWLFRLDDDEFPSPGLVPWLIAAVASTSKTVIAVPRRAVAMIDGRPQFAATIPRLDPGDQQYRGFVVASAKFSPTLHSPGILGESTDVLHAPADCCIYHFDWIVRNRRERARKHKKYESIAGAALEKFRHQYLYEDFDRQLYGFTPVDDPSIAHLALKLHTAKADVGGGRPSKANNANEARSG